LTLWVTWDDDADPTQTYRILIRDISKGRSYIVNGINAKQFLFDTAGQSQLFWGEIPLVFRADRTYALQVRGETDNQFFSQTLGYPQDICGSPTGPVICDVTDETSVSEFEPTREPPYGCQNEQVSGKVRIYYDEPSYSGYSDGTPVQFLGYVFQWALDSTFTSNVGEETCMDALSIPTIEDGAVCTFNRNIAQIPRNGTLSEGQYFIRVAAVVSVGVGPFTESVSVLIAEPKVPRITFTVKIPAELSRWDDFRLTYISAIETALSLESGSVSVKSAVISEESAVTNRRLLQVYLDIKTQLFIPVSSVLHTIDAIRSGRLQSSVIAGGINVISVTDVLILNPEQYIQNITRIPPTSIC
jgi:hypothetical protein